MIAITAKYFSPTNTKGSRYRIAAHNHKPRFVAFDYGSAVNSGIDVDAVRQYVRDCFPYADVNKLTGPHTIDDCTLVFTFTE